MSGPGQPKSVKPKPYVLSARSTTGSYRTWCPPIRCPQQRTFIGPSVWQQLWRGYAAAVGGIIIVAVWTAGGSAVISTRGGSADRSGTDSGSTDADRHSWAYTTVVATAVNATAVDTTAIGTTAVDTSAI